MRFFPLLALIILLVPGLITFAARIPRDGRRAIETTGFLAARGEPTKTTTADPTTSDYGTASTTGTTATTSASNTTESTASTTTASLNATSTTDKNGTTSENKLSPGELPLKPHITPALGVGGFILIALGAILALIGIRKLRVQVFLSASFLTSLGVIVLIIYVMNPPVTNAIQGAYLVAVFFSGITFGALSVVFKELTEGLGCLLGGFCSSMWLLCLKPGGLLTQTSPKSGFIAAISVAFYALSFSHYTRPHALIISTAISGGTAVALGVDCFSRAGLKEFWLYNWALNDKIFPLNTNTYPINRNIRVELAVTVIVALLGLVSQLRLWKVIRQRRRSEAKAREEEKRKNDEAEAEAGRRLEESNSQQRLEWEARYGGGGDGDAKAKSAEPESKEEPKQSDVDEKAVDLDKGEAEAVEVTSIAEVSEKSYRCSECREREANGDEAYMSETPSKAEDDSQSQHHDKDTGEQTQEPASSDDQTPKDAPPVPVFDGAAAARVNDDNQSEVSALVGSEAGTLNSTKRFSRMALAKRVSVSSGSRLASQSQEALIQTKPDDIASNSSAEGVMDEHSALDSRRSSIVLESKAGEKDDTQGQGVEGANSVPKGSKVEIPAAENATEASPVTKEPSQEQGAQESELGHSEAVQKDEQNSVNGKAVEKLESPAEDAQENENLPIDEEQKKSHTEQQTQTAKSLSSEHHSPVEIPEIPQETERKPQMQDNSKNPPDASEQEVGKLAEPAQEPRDNASEEDSKSSYSRTENQKKELPVESKPPSREPSQSKRSDKQPPVQKDGPEDDKKKEEKVTLNADTVKDLPERTSKIVQSYRTNEWAKHLDDAEIPDPPPIQPIEEERPEAPVETEEVVAPVNVKELLQTPLNAQPPPAVEHRVSLGKEPRSSNEDHRVSHDSQVRQTDVPRSNPLEKQPQNAVTSPTSNQDPCSGPLPTQPAPQKKQEDKPKWKGPPPLLAVREDLMRNRLSSTSLSIDPWSSRISPRQSTFGTPPISPTLATPEDDDNVPLSQRRAMLQQQQQQQQQQQTAQAPPANPSPAPPQRTRPSISGQGSHAHAAMAAWRNSVREDLQQKRDSLGSTSSLSPTSPVDRSSMNLHIIENAVAEGMQRGDMTELHREAMRRMQATANRQAHSFFIQSQYSIPSISFVNLLYSIPTSYSLLNVLPCQPPFCLFSANHHRLLHSYYFRLLFLFNFFFFLFFTITPDALPSFSSPLSKTASSKAFAHSQFLPSSEVEKSSPALPTPRGHHHHHRRQRSGLTSAHQQHQWRADSISSTSSFNPSIYSKKSIPGIADNSRCILRPPAVRLANPVNHVPRVTPVAVPHPWQLSDENLPLEAHRDAYPLLTIPERRRSRLTSSPSSLVVERSQGETESWRTSIAVPRGQRRSGNSADDSASNHKTAREMAAAFGFGGKEAVADNLRAPEQAHLAQDATPARPRTPNLQRSHNVSSHGSLRSQSQIASVPSNSGQQQPPAEVAEELAWGPAHPCFPHPNPHVPIGSQEYIATRIIRIRRDWMVKGDLAPTYSNLYPEILDPLLSEQEFRRVIATVNDELIKAFNPFRLRNWIDGALGLVTGWLWEDLGAPAIKRHLQNVETWIENWNREVGAKDGVRIWSLRRTAYMSLDIQIPDPKVGIIQNDDSSIPGTRPSTGVGRGV